MNLVNKIKKIFLESIVKIFSLNNFDLNSVQIVLNQDKNRQDFGDLSCNIALLLSKKLNKNPKDIAQEIIKEFVSGKAFGDIKDLVESIEIAGPGFVNIFFTKVAWQQIARELFLERDNFFKLNIEDKKLKYLIEFVSANPTGPLHLGHGRGGIIGDTLVKVLNFLGHDAKKEFYINDAGNQINKFGESFKIRCLQELGDAKLEIPEDGYKGEYLIDLAKLCVKEYGQDLFKKDNSFFENYAKNIMLELQKKDLKDYGIVFDNWFSELTLHNSGAVDNAIKKLQDKKLIYEQDGALWFKSTEFGDDKDRVVKKNTGELTYIAADIAYHENKFKRGFEKIIDILGQDHHGYVMRLKATVQAMGYNADNLDVILYQLVNIKNAGQVERMSKRAGKFTELKDVVDTVGCDVARFFYLNRKAEAHLDFDLSIALKKTDENPVFYIQYAYVRTKGVLEKAGQEPEFKDFVGELLNNKLSQKNLDICLNNLCKNELEVVKKLIFLNDILIVIQNSYQTHLLSYYTIELANLFHSYYANNRIIDKENIELSKSRMLVLFLVRRVLGLSLDLLGLTKPERM
ncbi:MAG: Arginine-tRNA ligase [candidate division TM6 bacterium GW2011_GWF2_28_16]|nr:MAG: Arginine-tRNA ligase [candidate division TM6 bacterium GW2011_GWF2_28_16]